jgi:hypothetical protein
MSKKKRFIVWAAFVLLLTAIPVTGLSARGLFPVSSFRITMISGSGPVWAWSCGAWSGVEWSPDYFSAEWAPWNGSGLGLQSLSYVPHLWWTGGNYYFYKGYVPFAWKYWRPHRRGDQDRHNAPGPVEIQNAHPRHGGASSKSVKGRRRPSETSAAPARVPRGRPRVRPRPMPSAPVMMPRAPVVAAGGGGRHGR